MSCILVGGSELYLGSGYFNGCRLVKRVLFGPPLAPQCQAGRQVACVAHQQQASEGPLAGWSWGPLNSPPFPLPPSVHPPQVGELNKLAFVLDSRFRRPSSPLSLPPPSLLCAPPPRWVS